MKKEENDDSVLSSIEETSYNDVPDYSGYNPDCPECGETMGFSYIESEFKCPSCGFIMDEDDWVREDEEVDDDEEDLDEIPYECRTCGGPYPDCIPSCKRFDN